MPVLQKKMFSAGNGVFLSKKKSGFLNTSIPPLNRFALSFQIPEIIFENEDFVAINKPSGLLSIPDREGKEQSLKNILKEKYGSIFTVHRIDRDTSGLIVFAKNEKTHRFLSQAFEGRTVKKIYSGIVIGSLTEKKGTVDAAIMEHPAKYGVMVINRKGKESITDYEVTEDFGIFSLLRFRIYTGRTHQIRVHMQHIGHPVVCDPLYGNGQPVLISSIKKKYKLSKTDDEERPILNRLALHSEQMSFEDENGLTIELDAPLPKDMRALLQQLKKWKS
jgi:23S rRNA pseudouridine955/2504/2580 synthase/23S rRNA pseudouridine1911/1915/1917 synthase